MSAAPRGLGQNLFDALLRGQRETPEETTYLVDAQRHTSPCAGLRDFFNGGAAGRRAARSTVNSVYAYIANVICRFLDDPLQPLVGIGCGKRCCRPRGGMMKW